MPFTYNVAIRVNGGMVTMLHNGVDKVSRTYAAPFTGKLGLGAGSGVKIAATGMEWSMFDNVRLEN